MYINFVRLLHVLWSLSLLRPSLRPPLRVLRNSYRRHRHPRYRHFCLILSFRVLFIFRRFLPSVCLSDFQSLPPYMHIYHIIYIQGSSRHLTSQKLVRCVRADISSERAARACERVSIASERKEQKNTHYNLHPGLVPTSTSPTKHCVRTA